MIIHKLNREEIVSGCIIDSDNFPFLIGCDMQELEELLNLLESLGDQIPSNMVHWKFRIEQITGPRPVNKNGITQGR